MCSSDLNAASLKSSDYALWAPRLRERLEPLAPRIICFHGITAYRAFTRYALGAPTESVRIGLQERLVGESFVFVTPNPSPANAHYRVEDQTRCYDDLAAILSRLPIALDR